MPLTDAPSRTPRTLAAAFPVALGFLSTFFFLGDTGRWNDDYFCTLRNPETGAIESLAFTGHLHFWRPLYRIVTPTLHTLLWQHLSLLHLVGAIVHAATTGLLWRFLRQLGIARLPAAIAALTFLVYPVHYEASLWPTAMPTALATALHLVMCILYLRWARGGLAWWLPGALALVAFAVASLNEQPAGGVVVLPLIYFAARPRGEPVRKTLARALIPVGAAVLALLIYIAGHFYYVGPSPRTGNGSMVSIAEAPAHLKTLSMLIGDRLDLNRFGRGAFIFGWEALQASPVVLAVWGLTLLVSAAAWVRWQADAGADRETGPASPVRPVVVILLGLALFFAQWLAIAPMHYWINSRLFYAPMVGAAIVIAGLGDLASRLFDRSPRSAPAARLIVATAFATALTACAVMMIGIQAAYRARDRQDQRDAATLLAAIPNPGPGSTLIPLHIRAQAYSTGSRNFDLSFRTPFMSWWSATNFTRFSYRRSDLNAAIAEWKVPALRGIEDGAIVSFDGQHIPLDLAIPFVIDETGQLRIVTSLRVQRPGHEPQSVPIPQTTEAAASGRTPERVETIKLQN